jgi:hypothetical protein
MKHLLKKQQENQKMVFSNENYLSISEMLKTRGGNNDEDPPIIKPKI